MNEITEAEFKAENGSVVNGFQTFYRDGKLVQRKIYDNGYTEEIRGVTKYYV
jgi:antitoxin component YwqK of YwqJK toxin-antitoxin module